ncbi:MAG: hypothetical protein ACOYMS_08510, partial [Terrimicrobiaceae bacterium]
MNARSIKLTALAVCVAMVSSACENLSSGENAALFGGVAALAVGIPLAAAGVNPNIVIPVTMGAAALAAGGAYVISKQQASIRQRKIAEQRARLYLAQRANAQKKAARVASSSSSSSSGSGSKKSSKPKPQPRFIAVKTERESQNKGQASVMIFDTQS